MGLLYILKSADKHQIKIGVTDSALTLRGRLTALGGLALFDLAESAFFECERPRVVEQFLHHRFDGYRIPPSDAFVHGAGKTECFAGGALAAVLNFVEENCLVSATEWAHLNANRPAAQKKLPNAAPQPPHDAHVIDYLRADARTINAQVLLDVSELIRRWNGGGHIVGRYRDAPGSQQWVLALRNTEVDPLQYIDQRQPPAGKWPAYWARPVSDPYHATGNGYGWFLFRSMFNHGGEFGCGVALPIWLTTPAEVNFIDSLVIDESLQDLHMLLLNLPSLSDHESQIIRNHHAAGRRQFFREFMNGLRTETPV